MPLTADSPIVDEHIRTTFALNEAITLGIVEPLHIPSLTRRHLHYSGFLFEDRLAGMGSPPLPSQLAQIVCKRGRPSI
jgi:hypothetical protein